VALQTSGQISLKNIADEFGDTAPHSMSEFYGAASGVPTSGAISIGNFYGKSSGFTFTKTISSNTQNYNLRNDMIAAGWDGVLPATVAITINSGVYVWASSTGTAAFTTGTMSSGTTISIVNNGYIMGKGGNGGAGGGATTFSAYPGSAGGPAINLNYPVSFTNNSYIGGGGGGGGGSGAYSNYGVACGGGGGAGGGTGGAADYMANNSYYPGGAGGGPGVKGSNGQSYTGGGGGRIMPGVATTAYSQGGQAGGNGARYFNIGNGSYGRGGGGGSAGGGAVNDGNIPRNSGGGGGWGASGGAGLPGGAGAGGKAVNLNGNTVTWVATGTRYGAIS